MCVCLLCCGCVSEVFITLFTEAIINKERVRDAFVDTVSVFSIIRFSCYSRRPSKPSIQPINNLAPDIVKVNGASAELKEYIDVSLWLA